MTGFNFLYTINVNSVTLNMNYHIRLQFSIGAQFPILESPSTLNLVLQLIDGPLTVPKHNCILDAASADDSGALLNFFNAMAFPFHLMLVDNFCCALLGKYHHTAFQG